MLSVGMKSHLHSKITSQRWYLYTKSKSPLSLPLDTLKKSNFILWLKTCFSWTWLVHITLVSVFYYPLAQTPELTVTLSLMPRRATLPSLYNFPCFHFKSSHGFFPHLIVLKMGAQLVDYCDLASSSPLLIAKIESHPVNVTHFLVVEYIKMWIAKYYL